MVRVLILSDDSDDAAVQAARHSTRGAVVMDLDAPFDAVVEALMPDRDVPGPGFVAQARRNAAERQAFLDAYGALTAEQVADVAESAARNRRQTAHRWASERAMFGIEHRGRIVYPGFQFDPTTRRPWPAVKAALERLPDQLTGWALALWWTTPVCEDGEWVTPVDLLADPDRVARLAEAEAAGWRHDAAA